MGAEPACCRAITDGLAGRALQNAFEPKTRVPPHSGACEWEVMGAVRMCVVVMGGPQCWFKATITFSIMSVLGFYMTACNSGAFVCLPAE